MRAGDEICIGGGGGGRGPCSLAGVRRVLGVLAGYRCVLDSARKLTGWGSRESPVHDAVDSSLGSAPTAPCTQVLSRDAS